MSLKYFTIQSLIIVSIIYFTIQYLTLTHFTELQLQQENLSNKILFMETRLSGIDKKINRLTQSEFARNTNQATKEIEEEYDQKVRLYRWITTLEEKQNTLEETVASLVLQQEDNVRPQSQLKQNKSHGWLSTLPEEKKSLIKEIYQDQILLMQEQIPASPGDIPPNSEEMQSILHENREELKVRLKEILNQEEYQSFLNSIPPLPIPPL